MLFLIDLVEEILDIDIVIFSILLHVLRHERRRRPGKSWTEMVSRWCCDILRFAIIAHCAFRLP
ncbi:hypothetical protein HanRHA438_Chr11g0520431 [Helianthus annuus]|nr:hypothetical protein HanRHA438_Chr11g0520431 [Helianthus annuus]